jgi:hypothetical protein
LNDPVIGGDGSGSGIGLRIPVENIKLHYSNKKLN